MLIFGGGLLKLPGCRFWGIGIVRKFWSLRRRAFRDVTNMTVEFDEWASLALPMTAVASSIARAD